MLVFTIAKIHGSCHGEAGLQQISTTVSHFHLNRPNATQRLPSTWPADKSLEATTSPNLPLGSAPFAISVTEPAISVGRTHIGGPSGHKAYKKLQGQVGVPGLDLGVRLPERERSVHSIRPLSAIVLGTIQGTRKWRTCQEWLDLQPSTFVYFFWRRQL